MLQNVIPTAFIATLLRRYLDSLHESPEYVETFASTLSAFGAPASATICVGIAVYGLSRIGISRKAIFPSQSAEISEQGNRFLCERKGDPLMIVKKKRPKGGIRKRYRKHKQWFLKNMKHYKSRYGRQIGNIINKLVGYPSYNDSWNVESMNFDDTSEDDENDICNQSTSQVHDINKVINDDSKPQQTTKDPKRRNSSSSTELRNLLWENFERQKTEKEDRRSLTQESENSEKHLQNPNPRSRRSSHNHFHNRYSKNSSRRSSSDDIIGSNRRRNYNRRNVDNKYYSEFRSSPKKTRSGRCYDKFFL